MIVYLGIGDHFVLPQCVHREEGMGNPGLNHDRLREPRKNGIDKNARNPMTMKNVFPRLQGV